MSLTATLSLFIGSLSLVLAAYPSHYEVGYGFVNHGGITPHGHYLPGSAKVKVHKDPFQSTYTLDEEGPTHYKYVRHTTASDPILHHHHHGFPVHHPVGVGVGVGAIAPALPVHGVIGGIGGAAVPVAGYGGFGGHHYGGLGAAAGYGGLKGYGGLGVAPGYGGLKGYGGLAPGYGGLKGYGGLAPGYGGGFYHGHGHQHGHAHLGHHGHAGVGLY